MTAHARTKRPNPGVDVTLVWAHGNGADEAVFSIASRLFSRKRRTPRDRGRS